MPKLIFRTEGGEEKVIEIEKDIVTIGRNDPEHGIFNDISLEDKTVSRRHAKIVRIDDKYYIEDLESRNGTFVNNLRIKKAKLKHGDLITIGLNLIYYHDENFKSASDFIILDDIYSKSATFDLEQFIIKNFTEKIIELTDLDLFFEKLLKVLRRLIHVEKTIILMYDNGNLNVVAYYGYDDKYREEVIRRTKQERKAMIVRLQNETHSFMCAPVIKHHQLIGFVYLESIYPNRFGEGELILLNIIVNQMILGLERIELNKKLVEETILRISLERFFSPSLVERIFRDIKTYGKFEMLPEKAEATILFLDIVGFTKMIERFSPLEISEILCDFFNLAVNEIFEENGVLDKYVGDGLMAIFGVPEKDEDHAIRAVRCGLNILDKHSQFISNLPDYKKFNIRIGIESGDVIVGYMGSSRRLEYTAIGYAVVAAKRLESLAKPNSIYVGKETYMKVSNRFKFIFVDRLPLPKGERELEVWEVLK